MHVRRRGLLIATTAALFLATSLQPSARGPAAAGGTGNDDVNPIEHVLLISIDGMHAVDYTNCVKSGTCPTLAELGEIGVNYRRTSTSKPSDSAPGLTALVTGGTPRTTGIYYDVAYDRVLAPPQHDTPNGVFSGDCVVGQVHGTTTEYEEGVDINQNLLNGGGPFTLLDGGFQSIDSTRLPRDPFDNCNPVFPWNFLRVNTIYGVIHAAGGFTAWSDKHAVYASVSGPTRPGEDPSQPSNLDDYYSPDVNSNIFGLPGISTPSSPLIHSINCNPSGDPNGNGPAPDDNGGAWTDSFENIKCYDTLKVHAVLNWIRGRNHLGTRNAPVPVIFGMNFQAVSVGQKLIEKVNGSTVFGGYTFDQGAAAVPTPALLGEIEFVDASIGEMVSALKQQPGLFESTAIIITAKHGQSSIDPNRFQEVNKGISTSPADVLASFLPAGSPENPNTPDKTVTVTRTPLNKGDDLSAIGPTQDDVSLLWLAKDANLDLAIHTLETSGQTPGSGVPPSNAVGLGQIFVGGSLQTLYDRPGIPKRFPGGDGGDSRTPDIIAQPNVGVIYTKSSKKQEEHGGFAQDDTNVMILVANPNLQRRTVTSFVETMQVAPTILRLLGLDPNALDAVRLEGTAVLPGLEFK